MEFESLPLVSVVIPSYQQGQFIEDTLISIFNQNYPKIEVVVVDGGSIDQTLDVLKQYAARLTYISETDEGQSDAINKGFKIVKGEIVTWINSDDIYPERGAVSRMVETFRGNPEVQFVYGDFIEINEDNKVFKVYQRPDFSISRLLRIGYISQPATFFRRTVIDCMPVQMNLTYAMDLEYWLRAYSLGFKFMHVDYIIAAERLHKDAKCVSNTESMEREAREVRIEYGGKFGRFFLLYRFVDQVFLYICRLRGIRRLVAYRSYPEKLTISLTLDGSIIRTIFFKFPKVKWSLKVK